MIDSRKKERKSVELPKDYLKILTETLNENFKTHLQSIESSLKNPKFISTGKIFQSEIVLGVSLTSEGTLVGSTLWASMDFDPSKKEPTPADLLNTCADVIAAVINQLFETPEVFSAPSLTLVDHVPFEWSPIDWEKQTVFVKFDKSNPAIDKMTEDWLKKNDPDYKDESHEPELKDLERDDETDNGSSESFH